MFKFRLQTVLELRQRELEETELALQLARGKRLDAESDRQGIDRLMAQLRGSNPSTFQGRLDACAYNDRLEDEARALDSLISVLRAEEEQAEKKWIEARKEVKALENLREKALAEHNAEVNRKEQAALDEWATMRRAA